MTSEDAQHPMAVVTRRTGLRPDVIRAWERRHRVVEPARTQGNHRLYSERDIQRLVLIRRALEAGWQIGNVASLSDEEIRTLLGRVEAPAAAGAPQDLRDRSQERLLALCLDDIARLDAEALAAHLDDAAVELGRIGLVDDLLIPLIVRVGDACGSGKLRIVNEHLASAVVARLLESLQGAYPASERAPGLVVTTPAFQHHHLGALLVAATGRMEGWKTTYLGPNLPAEEIAAAARLLRARAVALSVTYPANDPNLGAELERLGRALAGSARILVGGSAARSYQTALDQIGAIRLDDLPQLRAYLQAEQQRDAGAA